MRRKRVVLAAGLLLMAGCSAGWRNIPMSNQGSFAPRQDTQVFVHGAGPFRLKQLHWTPDSVFGRPYLAELDGDTIQVGIPRSRVDSVRVGNPSGAAGKSIGLGVLITLGAAIALAVAACGTESQCGD